MNDERDPMLEALFAEAGEELGGADFTADVMRGTRRNQVRLYAGLAGIAALMLVLIATLVMPLQSAVLLLAGVLTEPLVVIGTGWLAWVLAPLNTVGTALIVGLRLLRLIQQRLRTSRYIN